MMDARGRDQGPLPLPQRVGSSPGPASLQSRLVRGNRGEVVKGPFPAWSFVPSFPAPALFLIA